MDLSAYDVPSTLGSSIERIRRTLRDAVALMDSPDYNPALNPVLTMDLTPRNTAEDNLAPMDPHTWTEGILDVGSLLVSFSQRLLEQHALSTANHTSSMLKHQMEARRLQEKLIEEQKSASTATAALKTISAENAVLVEQLRHQELSSASKIDVLHQKISYLESSLHAAQDRAKQNSTPSPSLESTLTPIASPELVSRPTGSSQTGTQTPEQGILVTKNATENDLEKDLRLATELMRSERENAEKYEVELKRAQADLERLKAHLMTVQDQSDEKEMELQGEIERLVAEREFLLANGVSTTTLVNEPKEDESRVIELEGMLENAQIQIAELEEEVEAQKERDSNFEATISNLETSLIQLQADQQSEVELHTIALRNQVNSMKEHIIAVEAKLTQNTEKLNEQTAILEQLPHLRRLTEEERSRREAIEYEADTLRTALNDAAMRLSSLTEGRDAMVAKPLVAKIFCTYLSPTTTVASKSELLHLMANILELTDEERKPLGILPIKPAEGSVGPLATPSRGLVSAISSFTGNVVSGSISKSRQWLTWGGQKAPEPSSSSSDTPSRPMPSLADVWIKILLEGSEGTKSPPEIASQANETSEPPPEAFKVPFPLPTTSATTSTTLTLPPTPKAILPTVTGATTNAQPPQTPTPEPQTHRPLPVNYYPPARPEPSQSPYLSQQQAMRSAFQAQMKSNSEQPAKPSS